MFTHVVLMRLTDDAPAGSAQAIVDALLTLPASIPELQTYQVSTDAGLAEDNYDIAVVATLADEAAYRAYVAAPSHQKIIVELIRPVLERRAAVQFAS